MSDWNISELLLIAAVGLFLFKPKELPRMVVSIVRAIRSLRDSALKLIRQLEEEIDRGEER